jgi:hypothetical protein
MKTPFERFDTKWLFKCDSLLRGKLETVSEYLQSLRRNFAALYEHLQSFRRKFDALYEHLQSFRRKFEALYEHLQPFKTKNDKSSTSTQTETIKDDQIMLTRELVYSKIYLFSACLRGDHTAVGQILDVFYPTFDLTSFDDNTGLTAFHLACVGGYPLVCEQLMRKSGKDFCLSLRSKEGKTGFEVAAQIGTSSAINALLTIINKEEMGQV